MTRMPILERAFAKGLQWQWKTRSPRGGRVAALPHAPRRKRRPPDPLLARADTRPPARAALHEADVAIMASAVLLSPLCRRDERATSELDQKDMRTPREGMDRVLLRDRALRRGLSPDEPILSLCVPEAECARDPRTEKTAPSGAHRQMRGTERVTSPAPLPRGVAGCPRRRGSRRRRGCSGSGEGPPLPNCRSALHDHCPQEQLHFAGRWSTRGFDTITVVCPVTCSRDPSSRSSANEAAGSLDAYGRCIRGHSDMNGYSVNWPAERCRPDTGGRSRQPGGAGRAEGLPK